MPLPGIVSSLLTHGDVERERTPRRARRMSEDEPEPTPGSHRDDDDDDDPGDEPGGDHGREVASSSNDAKRKKSTSRRSKEKQNKSDGGGASSATAPTTRTMELSMTEDAVNRPVEVSVPDDSEDGSLVVDDILITEVDELPGGWVVVDGQMELADAWAVQNLRKNEANEKAMTPDERAQMTAAKAKELTQFLQNEVWEYDRG